MLKHCRPDILARGHLSLLHRSYVYFWEVGICDIGPCNPLVPSTLIPWHIHNKQSHLWMATREILRLQLQRLFLLMSIFENQESLVRLWLHVTRKGAFMVIIKSRSLLIVICIRKYIINLPKYVKPHHIITNLITYIEIVLFWKKVSFVDALYTL